jgi:hypothetical protein
VLVFTLLAIVGSYMASSLTGWNPSLLKKQMMENAVAYNNIRLVEYAKETILKIGNKIKTYHSKHNMDRTGNLLNSLCWGVSYKGKLVEGGFFRDAVLNDKGIAKTSESFLHEWFSGDEKYLIPVDGRQLAEEYLRKVGNTGSTGWKVFFAILAPYWGYWEEGFRMTSEGRGSKSYNKGIRSFYKFAVMAETYDQVRRDLKPARKYYFNVSVPQYSHQKLIEKWNKQAGF